MKNYEETKKIALGEDFSLLVIGSGEIYLGMKDPDKYWGNLRGEFIKFLDDDTIVFYDLEISCDRIIKLSDVFYVYN